MNWQEILTILVPILGFMGWVYNRIEKKIEKFETKVDVDLRDIKNEISGLKDRVSRIEGQLSGAPHWEPKVKGE